ncbi:hypothetical protein BD769DRAFT_1389421 [Suillus cothurnatus]|nr:hypothetical protein BD769DRAFT_1389421 [Suillus cothurnatus]
MLGWGDQQLQPGLNEQHTRNDPPDPHSDFGFTYGHQLNNYDGVHNVDQSQPSWFPPPPQFQAYHYDVGPLPLAGSMSSSQAASHRSSWAPHQHWQDNHGPANVMPYQLWSQSQPPQGPDYGLAADQSQSYWQSLPSGQGLPQPMIAHPVPQRLYHRSSSQRFFAAWQPPPSPTANTSSPHPGPSPQTHQNDESQPGAPVPPVNPSESVLDDLSGNLSLSTLSGSSHQIFDNTSQYTTLGAPHRRRRRVPQEKASNRSAKRTKTRTHSSQPFTQFTIIPFGTQALSDQCVEEMKLTVFRTSLLPTDVGVIDMVDASCRTVANRQTDGTLQHWLLDKLENDEGYFRTRLEPVLTAISSSMETVVKIFAYVKYGLGFNYTTVVNDTHIVQRASCASNLVQDDAFIYGTLHVNGNDVVVAFSNPAIIALAGYFLYDSEHQFHRYIGDDLNFNPLLAMTATFCLWALQERITGICVPVEFLARTHWADYDRYALLLAGNHDFISKGSIVPRPVNELVHGIERTLEKRAHANYIAAHRYVIALHLTCADLPDATLRRTTIAPSITIVPLVIILSVLVLHSHHLVPRRSSPLSHLQVECKFLLLRQSHHGRHYHDRHLDSGFCRKLHDNLVGFVLDYDTELDGWTCFHSASPLWADLKAEIE